MVQPSRYHPSRAFADFGLKIFWMHNGFKWNERFFSFPSPTQWLSNSPLRDIVTVTIYQLYTILLNLSSNNNINTITLCPPPQLTRDGFLILKALGVAWSITCKRLHYTEVFSYWRVSYLKKHGNQTEFIFPLKGKDNYNFHPLVTLKSFVIMCYLSLFLCVPFR